THPCIFSYCFFFNHTAPTEIYTLSLHDALPISHEDQGFIEGPFLRFAGPFAVAEAGDLREGDLRDLAAGEFDGDGFFFEAAAERSEEHTSELQSRRDLVCRLLLEKKKEIRKMIL